MEVQAQQVFAQPFWFQRRFPGIADDYQYKFGDAKGHTFFASNPGPQTWGMLCPFDEILLGGRRGGGKSRLLIANFAAGDPTLSDDDPAKISYLDDPSFRGLLLREEYQSMSEFVAEAVEFFKHFGGKPSGNPIQIDFKSKARIYFNHLGDEDAFNKYRGWNLTKIGIEELTRIDRIGRYLKLLGSLRAVERIRKGKTFPALRTQIISTTNPDGPGCGWVKERFVECYDGQGNRVPTNTPMRDPATGLIRIFIPFGLDANPHLSEQSAAGKRYRMMLMAQDTVTRKQWIEGDWDAGTGKFFKDYRPDGPQKDEEAYPWARHLIKSEELKPWYPRWGSGDWGFDHPAAMHKFCLNHKDRRIHVYDEMNVRHVGSFELGALLAKWWHPELLAFQRAGKTPCITIHLGSDAFSKTDVTKTKAEQMEAGIKEVLGPYGAILLKFNEEEKMVLQRDSHRARLLFEHRKEQLQGHICIALKPVYVDRIAAWGYCRDLLRFRPAVLNLQTDDERDAYLKQVFAEEGIESYELQKSAMRNIKPEVLPKMQIWDVCRELDRCIRAAQHDTRADSDLSRPSKREDVLKFNADENGEGGDDPLESWRNGCIAFKELEGSMPLSEWVDQQVENIQTQHVADFGEPVTDPTRIAMIHMRQAAIYNKQQVLSGGTLNFARAGSMRHRAVQ